jgi:fatty-acyl-CoA synthase
MDRPETPAPTEWPRRTFAQALAVSAARWPMAEAMLAGGERLAFAALQQQVERVAANLHRLGLRQGEHMAILMGNCTDWAVLFLAAARLGAVTVPVNTRFKADELEYVLRQADIRMLCLADSFLGIDFVGMLRRVCPAVDGRLPDAALPQLRTVVVFGETVPAGALSAAELHKDAPTAPDPGVSPDDAVLIQYTSGTTSFPKGAMLSHDGMLRDAFHAGQRMGMGAGDRYYSARPLYHVAGTTLSLLTALLAGACYITTAHFHVAEGLRLMETERCTHCSGNDTMLLMLMNHPDFDPARIHLRGGIVAASATVLQLAAERMGMTGACSGYGLSEASPNVAMGPWDGDPGPRFAGFAQPMPGVEIRIADPDGGGDCLPGKAGEILIRGWCVMKGYYNMPEQTAKAVDADGWLHTGDLGVKDEAGRLRFDGRLKDMFRVGGENVAPAEVEDVLHRHPAIRQAQVVGVPDPRLVEVPAAFVILNEGMAASEPEIIAWCKERCANFRVPRYVRIVDGFDAIGMTGSAKVQKNKLRAHAIAVLGL